MNKYDIAEQFAELFDVALSNLSSKDFDFVLERVKRMIEDIEE